MHFFECQLGFLSIVTSSFVGECLLCEENTRMMCTQCVVLILGSFSPFLFFICICFFFLSPLVVIICICILLLWDIITMLLPFNSLEIVVDVFIFVVCLWA
jgi:hypothetical protein